MFVFCGVNQLLADAKSGPLQPMSGESVSVYTARMRPFRRIMTSPGFDWKIVRLLSKWAQRLISRFVSVGFQVNQTFRIGKKPTFLHLHYH
jgi:hypothetical protein